MVKLHAIVKAIAFLDLILLVLVQCPLFFSFTSQLFASILVVNVLMFTNLYSFRAFDIQVITSLPKALACNLAAIFLGSLLIVILMRVFAIMISIYSLMAIIAPYLMLPFLNYLIGNYFIGKLQPKNYLVIGKEETFGRLLSEVRKALFGKLNPAEYINPEPSTFDLALHNPRNRINAVLVSDMNLVRNIAVPLAKLKRLKIFYLSDVAEASLGRIPLEVLASFSDYYEKLFCLNKHSPAKRVFDISAAIFLLSVSFPFLIVFALLIYLESGAPIIFKQERIGQDNEIFTMYKFKTLKEVPESANPNDNIESRVTKIGRLMRKTRLDEFPQLINVLKGEMSLIGPRPEMIYFHKMCIENIPYYSYRNLLKPGITGWAQEKYQHTTTLEEYKRKTEYDLYYVKNKGFLLDLLIILRTSATMLGAKGSR